jgi:hypothetical protein
MNIGPNHFSLKFKGISQPLELEKQFEFGPEGRGFGTDDQHSRCVEMQGRSIAGLATRFINDQAGGRLGRNSNFGWMTFFIRHSLPIVMKKGS